MYVMPTCTPSKLGMRSTYTQFLCTYHRSRWQAINESLLSAVVYACHTPLRSDLQALEFRHGCACVLIAPLCPSHRYSVVDGISVFITPCIALDYNRDEIFGGTVRDVPVGNSSDGV